MPQHLYPPAKLCIYCGQTVLPPGINRFGDEHIIPLALGGNLILPEASCKICERIINREIETPVLQQEWGFLRAKRLFPTRNKKKRKTHIMLHKHDGTQMRVPVQDYPAPVPMYKFSEARALMSPQSGKDQGWTVCMLGSHDDEKVMREKYPEWNGQHRFIAQPYPFARLLAKIGYGYVVAEYGLGAFTPYVLDIILGRSEDYFYTVGGTWDIHPPIQNGDHITNIKLMAVNQIKLQIIVDIRLFSQVSTPSYHVVVGEVDLQNPTHLIAFNVHKLGGKMPSIPS